MTRAAWTLLLLAFAACRPSHRYENPSVLRIQHGVSSDETYETWDAFAVADLHLHPIGGSDCAELKRMLRDGARAAEETGKAPGAAASAARMAELVDALISQTHGAPYGGPGKLTLVLNRYPEGKLEADRSLFVVVPEPREEEVERTYQGADLQAFLHENRPEATASLKSGTLRLRRRPSGRLAFKLDFVIHDRWMGAEGETSLRR